MMILILASAASIATAPAGTPRAQAPEARVAKIAQSVDLARIRETVEGLVGFGTRHTLSSQSDPGRGIGAALRWTEARMKSFGLETRQVCNTVEGPRIPAPTRVCNVLAIQRGTERPNDVVIITGHIDSRVTDVMNASADAPGANDDGSGTAAVIEAARVLGQHRFAGTIVYAALSGEEQGLFGGRILADHARAEGWNVIANLNNDIVGNSCGSDGTCNDRQVRVFSEGPRWQGHEDLAEKIRSLGGENDAPSRNISRFLDNLAERMPGLGIDVMQVWRNDRFGRGGDHSRLLEAGYPAVRLTVAVENYNQQHQDLRTVDGVEYGDTIDKMDFSYLARVTRLNVAALAWLASAPPPPEPTVEGALSTDTTLAWAPSPGAAGYTVRWRRTDESRWSNARSLADCDDADARPGVARADPAAAGHHICVLKGIRVDDWVFGVSATSPEGFESPVASAVPGGAFKPYLPAGHPR